MHVLPTDAEVAIDHARLSSGNAMSYGADAAELLDVDVDELARVLALVAPDRFGWLQGTQLVQAQPTQNPADGRWRYAGLGGDLLACPALTAQLFDVVDNRLRSWPTQPARPGRAILQSRRSFAAITIDPLADRPRADACGFGDGLRRLPARDLPYNPLSTERSEPGILVHVHPVLPRIAETSQLQLPRSGAGGQPNESSQLALPSYRPVPLPRASRRHSCHPDLVPGYTITTFRYDFRKEQP